MDFRAETLFIFANFKLARFDSFSEYSHTVTQDIYTLPGVSQEAIIASSDEMKR